MVEGPSLTSVDQLFPCVATQLPHVRLEGNVSIDPAAMFSPQFVRYLLDGYVLMGNPLDPGAAVLGLGKTSGSATGASPLLIFLLQVGRRSLFRGLVVEKGDQRQNNK